ncbi:hypothetical protein EYF80_043920 [Liparis tanakae]|uniref:Uncharacterized protein n=1 Tax=Liparis tanakae TaxID=230148 RepID=A0A4Z2FX62_9TELE|nr:hypothetical protein EYF80_043920 [Liparis tanakae]
MRYCAVFTAVSVPLNFQVKVAGGTEAAAQTIVTLSCTSTASSPETTAGSGPSGAARKPLRNRRQHSQFTTILKEASTVLTGLASRHTYVPRLPFCTGAMATPVMLAKNATPPPATRGAPSFSHETVFTLPLAAAQLRLAALTPAMRTVDGPVTFGPTRGWRSLTHHGEGDGHGGDLAAGLGVLGLAHERSHFTPKFVTLDDLQGQGRARGLHGLLAAVPAVGGGRAGGGRTRQAEVGGGVDEHGRLGGGDGLTSAPRRLHESLSQSAGCGRSYSQCTVTFKPALFSFSSLLAAWQLMGAARSARSTPVKVRTLASPS